MKTWHRFTFAALACATALTLACSGKTDGAGGGDGGGSSGGSSGGSGGSSSGGAPAGCDDYFTAIYGSCLGGAALPASEITRLQGRFDTLCVDALALPGDAITSSALSACAAAVKSTGCAVLGQNPGPCALDTGTLTTGSSCVTGGQCQAGICTAGNTSSDGGQTLCGTCVAAVGVGQSCTSGQSCGPSATCNGSTGGGETCVAITYGAAGVACNGSNTQCNPGLYCDPNAQKCAAPGGAGAPCNLDEACTPPLACPAVTGPSTCQAPGGAGGPCQDDADCASGFGCGQTSHTCATVTFVTGGQACGDYARCLVGNCPFTSGATGGACPTVIPDGQPCTTNDATSTCDTFANCDGGKCLLGYVACP
jgi:hypothetical protein